MIFETRELDSREIAVVKQIDDLRQRLAYLLHEPRRWFGSLRRSQFARAVQGSNSIEGFTAALDDAIAIDLGEDPLDADEETRLAIEGYRDAMTYVLQLGNEQDFSYSTQLLKSLHFMMTNHDLENRPGLWRLGSIFVRNDETGDIVYEGPDVDDVPGLMDELVDRLNNESDVPAMVRAGMAHLNLVMIHPFKDGNGRMARCLQTLLLAREGIVSPVFASIEEYLGRNTQAYYDVLAAVGAGRWHPERPAQPWIRFTLTAHLRQARTVLRRVKESERLWSDLEQLVSAKQLPERITSALFDAATGLRVRNATYRAIEEDLSEQTASRDLALLVKEGLLIPKGEKRGRLYVGSPELRRLRRAIIDARDPRDDSDPFSTDT